MTHFRCAPVWAIGAIVLCAAVTGVLPAQSPSGDAPPRLPVGGSVVFNTFLYNAGPFGGWYWSGVPAGRFSGRISMSVARRSQVGLAVGSWQRIAGHTSGAPLDTLESVGEAVLFQAYAQHYPIRTQPVFARAGIGVGHTYTMWPAGANIIAYSKARLVVSGGVGADIHVGGITYLTPSLDFTMLPAVTHTSAEVHSAWAFGVALTLK